MTAEREIELEAALRRILEIPAKAWSIDIAKCIARNALGQCCDHDWQPGAEGAFAGLTEHCGKCGTER